MGETHSIKQPSPFDVPGECAWRGGRPGGGGIGYLTISVDIFLFFFPVLQVGPSVFAHGGQAPTTELHPDPILYYKEQHSPVGGVGGTLIPFHVWAGFDEPGEK
jgi:hypothetical protein